MSSIKEEPQNFTQMRLPKSHITICLISMVLLCVGTGHIASGQLRGDTYLSAKKKGSGYIVVTHVDAPGFVVGPGSGPLKGICADLMNQFVKYIKDKEGIELKILYNTKDTRNFTQFLKEVKQGDGGVFGLSNTTITKARKAEYNFSSPFITNIAMTLTNNKVPTLTKPGDMSNTFAGFTALAVRGSTNEKNILTLKKIYYPDLKIAYVNSSQEVVEKLLANDKVLGNLDFTHYLDAVKNRRPIKRHPALDEDSEQFGVIMPKSNDWAPLLSTFIDGYVKGIEYKKSIANHLGRNALSFLSKIK